MGRRKIPASILFLGILTAMSCVTTTQALTKKVLHNFNGKNGAYSYGGNLTVDSSGNLYGTTSYGGDQACNDGFLHGCGVVFELIQQEGGHWAEKELHYFGPHDPGGYHPNGGLVLDAAGNLYGTTESGGGGTCGQGGWWCGAIFQLIPQPDGTWKEVVVHSFSYHNNDGIFPRAGLVFDASGNLYGTTRSGGGGPCSDGNLGGCGTVFELTPTESGWTEQVLYSFMGQGFDGTYPSASLTLDASGNLYGTTTQGGAGGIDGGGTVFELTPIAGGGWTENILHTFDGSWGSKDGNDPTAGLTFDSAGNLFGTTAGGPPQGYGPPCDDGTDLGCGTVFELIPNQDGTWAEKILHYFSTIKLGDGDGPDANVIFDASGNVYSTTWDGGNFGWGTIFQLMPNPDGRWKEKILSFNGRDGGVPHGVFFDSSGNLYGVTTNGGTYNMGTVFEIIP